MTSSVFVSLTDEEEDWCKQHLGAPISNRYTPNDNRAQQNPEQKLSQKMAEYANAKYVSADAAYRATPWSPDYDIPWVVKLEVKSVDSYSKTRLLWPVEKNKEFWSRKFSCLVLARTELAPTIELVGWISKLMFYVKKHEADGTIRGLAKGTWCLSQQDLEPMHLLLLLNEIRGEA